MIVKGTPGIQAITWTSDGQIYRRIYASLGLDQLLYFQLFFNKIIIYRKNWYHNPGTGMVIHLF